MSEGRRFAALFRSRLFFDRAGFSRGRRRVICSMKVGGFDFGLIVFTLSSRSFPLDVFPAVNLHGKKKKYNNNRLFKLE